MFIFLEILLEMVTSKFNVKRHIPYLIIKRKNVMFLTYKNSNSVITWLTLFYFRLIFVIVCILRLLLMLVLIKITCLGLYIVQMVCCYIRTAFIVIYFYCVFVNNM